MGGYDDQYPPGSEAETLRRLAAIAYREDLRQFKCRLQQDYPGQQQQHIFCSSVIWNRLVDANDAALQLGLPPGSLRYDPCPVFSRVLQQHDESRLMQQQLTQLQQDLQRAQQQLQQQQLLQLAESRQEQLAAEVNFWHRKACGQQSHLQQLRQQPESMASELELWQQRNAEQQLAKQQQSDSVAAGTAAPAQELVASAGGPEHTQSAVPSHGSTNISPCIAAPFSGDSFSSMPCLLCSAAAVALPLAAALLEQLPPVATAANVVAAAAAPSLLPHSAVAAALLVLAPLSALLARLLPTAVPPRALPLRVAAAITAATPAAGRMLLKAPMKAAALWIAAAVRCRPLMPVVVALATSGVFPPWMEVVW